MDGGIFGSHFADAAITANVAAATANGIQFGSDHASAESDEKTGLNCDWIIKQRRAGHEADHDRIRDEADQPAAARYGNHDLDQTGQRRDRDQRRKQVGAREPRARQGQQHTREQRQCRAGR